MSKSSTTTAAKVNRVLVLIDATPQGGKVVLRALQGWQTTIAEQTVELAAQDFTFNDAKLTGDHAKVIAIIKALKRLTSKLPDQGNAGYRLVIVHSSKAVQTWLTDPTSRKADLPKTLTGYVDKLAVRFPQLQFEQRERKVITKLMAAK
ncbi:MAG: hypothetical protein HY862_13630 [Chloroflexi bacterium]|nr:hypothetical protein [Chloroflexota bacterium]